MRNENIRFNAIKLKNDPICGSVTFLQTSNRISDTNMHFDRKILQKKVRRSGLYQQSENLYYREQINAVKPE